MRYILDILTVGKHDGDYFGMHLVIAHAVNNGKNGGNGRIVAKMNSLTDRELISKFIEASEAGVKINLIVRGICCLVPGVAGKTENIIPAA